MADFEENVEEMVGTTREAVGGDRVRRGRDRRSRRLGDETGDKKLWNLDAEFTRYTRWPEQSSIIDPVTNAANVKKALYI